MAKTTTKATEAKKLKKIFGEFLKDGRDVHQALANWKGALFDDPKEYNQELLLEALNVAKIAGIDLNKRGQIYVKDGKVIIGIHGLVTAAENTGQYGGTTMPNFEMNGTKIISCSIGVKKVVQGNVIDSFQTVDFNEYNDADDEFWKTKPKTMIKKVAQAHALRATFSVCAGMFIAEEVSKAVQRTYDSDNSHDALEAIRNAETREDIRKINNKLSVPEKKKVAPLIAERLKVLK